MFGYVPQKQFLIIKNTNNETVWYLADAGKHQTIHYRNWTKNISNAIKFETETEAETVGNIVCYSDEFTIESYPKYVI